MTETEKFVELAREWQSALITAAVTGQINVAGCTGQLRMLEEILGRPVDVVTPSGLANPYFRQGATQTRELIYAA